MKKELYSKKLLESLIKDSKTYKEVLEKLNVYISFGKYTTLKKYIKKYLS